MTPRRFLDVVFVLFALAALAVVAPVYIARIPDERIAMPPLMVDVTPPDALASCGAPSTTTLVPTSLRDRCDVACTAALDGRLRICGGEWATCYAGRWVEGR